MNFDFGREASQLSVGAKFVCTGMDIRYSILVMEKCKPHVYTTHGRRDTDDFVVHASPTREDTRSMSRYTHIVFP